jgi:hypothetical protein
MQLSTFIHSRVNIFGGDTTDGNSALKRVVSHCKCKEALSQNASGTSCGNPPLDVSSGTAGR